MANLIQDIKYEGDNATFVWKSPIEDFTTGSTLTVRESQEAVFFMNGQALDLYGAGRHVLETQNIPLLQRLFNKATNDKSPYHCDIYFINKAEQMAIKWGTDSMVEYTDPVYNFALKIGLSGEMSLRVEDSRILLTKLVGAESLLGQAQLTAKFRAILMSRIKSLVGKTMREQKISIFDVDAEMDAISDALHQRLKPDFVEYGLALEKFFVGKIVKPEDDSDYRDFKSLYQGQYTEIGRERLEQQKAIIRQQTEAQKTVMEAQALAQKRQLEGYSYQQEQSFEVAKLTAQNEGAGNFSSAGIGLGMMTGIAGGMGSAIAGISAQAMNPASQSLGSAAPPAQAGQGPQAGDEMASLKQKIEKLKLLKESGMLSDEEFDAEKKKLLSSI